MERVIGLLGCYADTWSCSLTYGGKVVDDTRSLMTPGVCVAAIRLRQRGVYLAAIRCGKGVYGRQPYAAGKGLYARQPYAAAKGCMPGSQLIAVERYCGGAVVLFWG